MISRISSRESLWKTITSSMRLRNSGRKTFFSSPMIRSFMSLYEAPVSSSETAKPKETLRAMSLAPMFEVMITIVLREVDRASLGVGEPAVLEDLEQDVEDVGVWAFSISSSSSTE